MVERDIVQHCNVRRVERDGAIAFINLADEGVPLSHQGAGERRVCGREVLHDRAVHHRRVFAEHMEDPADHSRDSRFATRPGSGNALRARIEQLREQIGARKAGAAKFGRLNNVRHTVLDRSRCDDDLFSRSDPAAILRKQRDRLRGQPVKFRRDPPLIE